MTVRHTYALLSQNSQWTSYMATTVYNTHHTHTTAHSYLITDLNHFYYISESHHI